MSEFFPDAEIAVALCKKWADELGAQFSNCGFYLFGSTIYEYGEQFDALRSDLDIICVLPPNLGTIDRLSLLGQLKDKKMQLELQMIPGLHRVTCDDPGVSLVPVTSLELKANVHKSAARNFFDKNIFMDLRSGKISFFFADYGSLEISNGRRQALEFCQKIRNEFLAVSANETGGIRPYKGFDPIPKAFLRCAAQIAPDVKTGAWYDTRYGLDYLFKVLGERKDEHETFDRLYKKISIRRGAKGQEQTLGPLDQLLLAEILFDEASKGKTEDLVKWRIVVKEEIWYEDEGKMLEGIAGIIPQAKRMSDGSGSNTLNLVSTLSAFKLFDYFWKSELLDQFLGFKDERVILDVSLLNESETSASSREIALEQLLRDWVPPTKIERRNAEDRLLEYLQQKFDNSENLKGAIFDRNIRLGLPDSDSIEIDFLLAWPDPSGRRHEPMGIEITNARSATDFVEKISRLVNVGRPLFLLLLGDESTLAKINDLDPKLRRINPNLHVLTFPLTASVAQ